jgi:hypothetical protein
VTARGRSAIVRTTMVAAASMRRVPRATARKATAPPVIARRARVPSGRGVASAVEAAAVAAAVEAALPS